MSYSRLQTVDKVRKVAKQLVNEEQRCWHLILSLRSAQEAQCRTGLPNAKVEYLKTMSKFGLMASFSMESLHEKSEFKTGAILDVACSLSEKILTIMSNRKLFSIDREWLFLENVNQLGFFNGTYTSPENNELYILPGSSVTIAQYSISMVAFYDMYRIVTWTPMKYELLVQQYIDNYNVEILRRKGRTDFEGVTLRTGTVILMREQFKGFGSLEHLEADFYAKTSIFVAQDVAFQLNFSTSLVVENLYGYLDKNGNFDGLMGRIQRYELDLIATGVLMREDRMDIADFTGDVYEIRSPIIFRQPSLSAVSNIFLFPFSLSVWISAGVIAVVFGVVLYISYHVGDHLYNVKERYDISASETVTTILSCICQQGPPAINEVPRGRITLFLFELMIFFLFVAYSAKIVALLQSSMEKIKTISDLTNSPFEVGMQDIIYNKLYFQETTDPDHKTFYLKKIKPHETKSYMGPKEGLSKLRSGMFAFKVESEWSNRVIADTFDESEKCGLGEIKVFDIPRMSMPVPKRSGLREHITRSIAKQTEVGLLKRVTKPFTSSKPKCNAQKLYTSVSLVDFKPAIMALAFGAMLSVSFLLVEIFMTLRKNLLKKLSGRYNRVEILKKMY